MYKESDRSDANHLYGQSKYIGELNSEVHNTSLSGLYHVSARETDKFKLLSLVSERYQNYTG